MHSHTNLSALAAAILLLATTSQAQMMTLSPSAAVPSGASPTVNPAFAAYAFEERSFYSYTSKSGHFLPLFVYLYTNAVCDQLRFT